MSKRNRMGNASNPYQTDTKRVLCLCSAGLLRSPTTANVLHEEWGYNTRSAGLSEEYALIPVDDVLIDWADEVVVMEKWMVEAVLEIVSTVTVTCLDIPDNFSWNEENLRERIRVAYEESME